MTESQKPFACSIEGCEMTFTNEDHLNWHHKKHDMVLNLGLANKSAEVADQTPTPTRFIRNCEEVGLFQDLQNVNPFDETFKKAIESGKAGTLHVPETSNNDDTLHTPHIFPHVEENVEKYIERGSDNHSSQSADFCITNVVSLQNQENNDAGEYSLTIMTDGLENDSGGQSKEEQINLKDKLKKTIINKAKSPGVITPVPFHKLKSDSSTSEESGKKQKSNNTNVSDGDKEKVREMNRAAQLRCRKRKQIQWRKMEEEVKMLKSDNNKLSLENQLYRHKMYELKELLLQEQNKNNNVPLLKKIEVILHGLDKSSKKNKAAPSRLIIAKKQKAVVKQPQPITAIPVQTSGTPKPFLIQVMGNVAQLAVSVLPNNNSNHF